MTLPKRIHAFVAGFLLLALWPAAAAEISVPGLEMASRGMVYNDEFIVSSAISADLALSGGYKYAKILVKPLEYDAPKEMAELIMGVRTAF